MKCNIKGMEINYEIIGEGKPFLCLHGYGVDHRLMKHCIEPALDKDTKYKRIYVDWPGMGLSEINDSIYTTDDFLDFILEFIKIVIGDEKFVVAGESFGAYLTYGLLYKLKEQLDGVFLICPPANAQEQHRDAPDHIYIVDEEIEADYESREYREFRHMAVISNQKVYDRFLEDNGPGIKLARMDILKPYKKRGYAFSFESEIPKIKFDKPATVLLGKQDHLVGYKEMLFFLDNFSRGTFTVLDGAGHNLQIELPELLEAHIKEFLNKA
ncbi:MAG: alpha/beta hydrolase [Erysipelotrichales bacterium]